MIALIQRVNWAQIHIDENLHSKIDCGLLAFVGIEKSDETKLAQKLLDKILAYRVFSDSNGKMNLSLKDISGDLMLVSQFTLAADTGKGLRPGFSSAKAPDEAERIYNHLLDLASSQHDSVASGKFAADMQVTLENNGPVTFILRSN
ncbi:MAG: D-tyrosyl-tRNA(Tyr) deacylase [SAR86 cluster bacterium]|uniref:D-aminoacyl-tRNA deacylase n=1 Tax=SAR86 cluster bacterium TaxID=2030880 RepID=A0A2A5AX38_9GAMM|nr:MAG: D-tyrosyl-tRNA(Tyr) deacylase [SAR86 cluster bacterium]